MQQSESDDNVKYLAIIIRSAFRNHLILGPSRCTPMQFPNPSCDTTPLLPLSVRPYLPLFALTPIFMYLLFVVNPYAFRNAS